MFLNCLFYLTTLNNKNTMKNLYILVRKSEQSNNINFGKKELYQFQIDTLNRELKKLNLDLIYIKTI
jgi:hypothetical protein